MASVRLVAELLELPTDLVRRITAGVDPPSRRVMSRTLATFFELATPHRFAIIHQLAGEPLTSVGSALITAVLTRDESPLVRHEAAFAAGCSGTARHLRALRTALRRDPSTLVRHEAAMAIGELGTRRDIALLRQGASDPCAEVSISCIVAYDRLLRRLRR